MKELLLIIGFIFSVSVYGQDDSHPADTLHVNKMGAWVIGEFTESDFRNWAKDNKIKIKDKINPETIDAYTNFQTQTKKIYKIINGIYPEALVPEVVNLYLIDFVVISGVEMANVHLYFHNSKLFKVRVSEKASNVADAFEMKYGLPLMVDKRRKITCRNTFQTYDEMEGAIEKVWGRGTDVVSTYSASAYFTPQCKRYIKIDFTMEDKNESRKVEDIRTEKLLKEYKSKVKDLSGF